MRAFTTAVMIMGLALCLAGCARERTNPIRDATRIDVFVENDTQLGRQLDFKYGDAPVAWCNGAKASWCSAKLAKTIDDPAVVAAASRFANERLNGWGTPFGGAPIPSVTARFYNERGEIVGTFGVGSSFFARGSMGMLSRTARADERERYLRLLGIGFNDLVRTPRHDRSEPLSDQSNRTVR